MLAPEAIVGGASMLTMPVMRWMAVNIGIFLLTQSTGLVAKEPVEQSWENLKQLKVEQEIQVVQMNVKSLQGTFVGFSEEAISLRVKQNEVTVHRADVLRVSSLYRGKRKRNILLGLAIGAGVGMLAGGGVASAANLFDEGQGSKPATTILAFTAAGAAAGSAVGASSGYRTIYRTNARRRR